MGLMMLGAGMGATIELRAQGWDAREALEALAGLVEAGFDESGLSRRSRSTSAWRASPRQP